MATQMLYNLVSGYIVMGFLSYNLVAPVFDTFSGYMPPGLFKYISYGALWPIPVAALVCCLAHEKIYKIFT
jgi:hypothetical protein